VLVPMLMVFAVVAALAFAIERIDPARPQPIFRRAFLTDGVYCVTSIAIRAWARTMPRSLTAAPG